MFHWKNPERTLLATLIRPVFIPVFPKNASPPILVCTPTMSPGIPVQPFTSSLVDGEVVPIPTFWFVHVVERFEHAIHCASAAAATSRTNTAAVTTRN